MPPLLGDIEAQFSSSCALTALIIGNAASVSTIVEAMLAPQSTAWVLGLTVSSLIEMLTRTGTAQRFELWVAAGLPARFELQWPVRMVQTTALEVVYLRSLGGTGYVTPTMALCIGCLRAVAFVSRTRSCGKPFFATILGREPRVAAGPFSGQVGPGSPHSLSRLGRGSGRCERH